MQKQAIPLPSAPFNFFSLHAGAIFQIRINVTKGVVSTISLFSFIINKQSESVSVLFSLE